MLTHLKLINFRNYQEESFDFSGETNYIYGNNGVGKTNLLEAISLLVCGRSFKTSRFKDLVRQGQEQFYIEAHFQKNGIFQDLKMHYDGKRKKIELNSSPIPKLSELFGILRASFLLPEDEMLVKGQPAYRRTFLDLNLAQQNPLYIHHLCRYGQALKQRNCLLKEEQTDLLAPFEQEMATSAAYISQKREELTNELRAISSALYLKLSDQREEIDLRYKSQLPPETENRKDGYLALFEKERPKELVLGYSRVGPHRDDLEISLKKRAAKDFASEGQKRLCATALRLAQWEQLKGNSAETPLMCIDDIALALDKNRSKNLFDHLESLGQVFLTSSHSPSASFSKCIKITH